MEVEVFERESHDLSIYTVIDDACWDVLAGILLSLEKWVRGRRGELLGGKG